MAIRSLKKAFLASTISMAVVGMSACQNVATNESASSTVTEAAVVAQYANVAHATFEDALTTAQALQAATNKLVAEPTELNMAAAKAAWKQARVPYQQSEVFRFGNSNVDDWEGQLNAWPLDEGLIDYVKADSYEHVMGNVGGMANIIANKQLTVGTDVLDTTNITPELLASLNEIGGSEANVATGYHAIEFLLWGQDLNGTNPGAGQRPASDYAKGAECTGGNCDRRAAYLQAAVQLLVNDLQDMTGQWAENGAYRQQLLSEDSQQGLRKMLFGMGSLSLGELAGERMKVALEANSVEDEHDCFSDNTHNSHFYNAKGVQNVYLGQYRRVDGSLVSGASLSDLVRQKDATVDGRVVGALGNSMQALQTMVDRAEAATNAMTFDMMIAEGNAEGKTIVTRSIQSLVVQTGEIEAAARAIGINELNPDTADHKF